MEFSIHYTYNYSLYLLIFVFRYSDFKSLSFMDVFLLVLFYLMQLKINLPTLKIDYKVDYQNQKAVNCCRDSAMRTTSETIWFPSILCYTLTTGIIDLCDTNSLHVLFICFIHYSQILKSFSDATADAMSAHKIAIFKW